MAAYTGLFDSAEWEKSGGGTPVTVTKDKLSFPDLAQNPETIDLASGLARRLRDRDEITMLVHDISTFAALKTLMLSRSNLRFRLNGTNPHEWDPMRFSVRYVFDQVPNAAEIFIGADAAAGDPTSTPASWTSLGSIEGGNTPATTVTGPNDGVALPLYTTTGIDWTIRLIDDASTAVGTTLATFQRALCRIAVKSPDGTYLILGGATAGQGVLAQWSRAPQFGRESFASAFDLNVSGFAEDPDNLIVIPGAAPDYVYAFELSLAAVSTVQSDYYSQV